MPGNIVDVDTFPESLSISQDGEDADEASLMLMLQGIANRTRWLKRRIWGFGNLTNQWLTIPLQPIRAVDPIDDALLDGMGTKRSGNAIVLRQINLGGKATVYLPSILNGMLIKEIYAWGRGRGVHAALPDSLPRFVLRSHTYDGNTAVIGTGTGSSASVSNYHSSFEMSLSIAGSLSVVESTSYHIEFIGENGANAAADGFEILTAAVRVQGN